MNNKVYNMNKTAQLFPQAISKGISKFEHVGSEIYRAHQVEAEGKKYWLVEKTSYPYTVCQVHEFNTEQEFNNGLQTVLGIPNWAEYVEDDLTFLTHRGNHTKIDINQQNAQQVADDIRQALRGAATWWYLNREDIKKGAQL